MCRVLAVAPSGYHAWRKRTTPSQRQLADELLMARVRVAFEASHRTYGAPRVHADLQGEGLHVGRKRVARLMRQAGLAAVPPRRTVRTTDSRHAHPIAPNVVNRQFGIVDPETAQPRGLNHCWVSDITYLPTAEGWLYLAVVLDLGSRRCIGWSMRESLETPIAIAALQMALLTRRPPAGLVSHADRGVQYASDAYTAVLSAHGIVASMSRKGDCWDNAVAESFFATLEKEVIDRQPHGRWETRAAARRDVFAFIETWYNTKRRHSTLGYLSPVQYEAQLTMAA